MQSCCSVIGGSGITATIKRLFHLKCTDVQIYKHFTITGTVLCQRQQ